MTPKTRLKRIAIDFDTAIEALCEVVLPVIEKEVQSDSYAAQVAGVIARLGNELKIYLEHGKAEKEAMLDRVKKDVAILETTKYQLENAALLVEDITLANLLAKASKDDICQAVTHAVMIGDKERVLEGLKEGIKQVESYA